MGRESDRRQNDDASFFPTQTEANLFAAFICSCKKSDRCFIYVF